MHVFHVLKMQGVLKALLRWVSTVSSIGDRKSNFVSLDWGGVPEFGVRDWGVCGVLNANMVAEGGGGRYL